MIPENDPCRAYVFEAGLFEKENEMYFDLLPAIKFHCKKTSIQQLIPDCIYGSHNMDGAGKEGYELVLLYLPPVDLHWFFEISILAFISNWDKNSVIN